MKKKYIIENGWTIENEKYGKYNARVPGDIMDDLYRAGIIEDPLFGVNFKEYKWILESAWEYNVCFTVNLEDLVFPDAQLSLLGIDTFSRVFLNGEELGETNSMFVPFSFSVKDKLKLGENLLTVKMASPYDVYNSKKNEKYMCIFQPNRLFFRKASCHFLWDWAPDFPGYGIYRSVELVFLDEDNIIDTEIAVDLNGNASFITELSDKFMNKPQGYSINLLVAKSPNTSWGDSYQTRVSCEGRFVIANVHTAISFYEHSANERIKYEKSV